MQLFDLVLSCIVKARTEVKKDIYMQKSYTELYFQQVNDIDNAALDFFFWEMLFFRLQLND